MPRVNPEILTWARQSAGLSLGEAAQAIGLSGGDAPRRLEEMEDGSRDPTRPQLLKMADRYRRPLLTFYLPAPPAPSTRTHDFRTLPDRAPGSEAVLEALVRNVKSRQALVLSALEDADELHPLAFIGSVRPDEGANVLSNAISAITKFDRKFYRSARTTDDAFRILRDAVEATGVYVLLMGNLGHHSTNLSAEVFRGMALADDVAPFIVVNETDNRSAWSFTLLHEFGHLLLGQSGISGYDGDQAIERLCDEAAARVLLDYDELRQISISDTALNEAVEHISQFANARRISRKMVAYNLLHAGFITYIVYQKVTDRFDKERLELAARTINKGAPDYYVVRRHRVGRGLLRLVNRMVAGGALTTTKAGKVLGVKPTAVSRMTEAAASS